MVRQNSIQDLFYRGQYRLAQELLDSMPETKWVSESYWPAGIGVYSYSGRVREAYECFKMAESKHGLEARMECLHHLGVGFVRKSEYRQGRELFARALREVRAEKKKNQASPRAEFFGFLGAGFFHFFDNRFECSLSWALKADGAAIRAGFLYGKVLSNDLLGHVMCQMGKIREGLDHLRRARKLALQLRNDTFASATTISEADIISNYEADSNFVIERLTELEGSLDPEDTYSKTTLRLRKSQRLFLGGDRLGAKVLLEGLCDGVYALDNKRQASLINCQLAWMLFWEGQFSQCLLILKNAENSLDPAVDRRRLIRVLGLQLKTAQAMRKAELATSLFKKIEAMTATYGGWIERRILARDLSLDQRLEHKTSFRRGEDTLGDLIDDLKERVPGSLQRAVRTGNFGLISTFYEIEPGKKCLVIDRIENFIVICDQGQVCLQSIKLGSSGVGVLRVIANGLKSKEQIAKEVWGYEYHPERHDSLIYTTVARLRKALGQYDFWLEAESDGYRLKEGVSIIFWPKEEVTAKEAKRPPSEPPVSGPLIHRKSPALPDDLNHRQIKCLSDLTEAGISVTDYVKLYGGTKITASRDLSGLVKKGLLRVTGKARATRYFKSHHIISIR